MVGAGAASVLLSLGAVSRVINPYSSSALQPPMLVLPPVPKEEEVKGELESDASQQEFITEISKKEKEKLKAKNNAGLNSNSSTQNGNGDNGDKNNKNNTGSLAFAGGYGLANVLNKNKGGKSDGGISSEVKKIIEQIPNKLLTNNKLNLDEFTQRVRGTNDYVAKNGWKISKENSGRPHGGSAWKLFDKKGNRIATVDETGRILRE